MACKACMTCKCCCCANTVFGGIGTFTANQGFVRLPAFTGTCGNMCCCENRTGNERGSGRCGSGCCDACSNDRDNSCC